MAAVAVPELTAAEKQKRALDAKNEGNAAFKAKNYTLAIKHFSEAVSMAPEDHTLVSNRSAAYLAYGQASGDYEKLDLALEDAERCVELQPSWGKGYLRRAAAQQALSHFEDAVTGLAEGLGQCPTDVTISEALKEAQDLLVKAKSGELGAAMQRRAEKETKSKKSRDKKNRKHNKEPTKYVIGIDLGTTFSCVGVWKDDGVVILSNEDGERTTPSYIAFDDDGNRFTGQQARAMQSRYPKSTVYDIKRVIGQRYNDPGVEKDIRSFPFSVVKGDGDKVLVEMPVGKGKTELFAPEALSALVLERLKKVAENYLGEPVTDAVITVPAYFNDAQRNATKAAGAIAGLNVLRIINEPTAAALSYGLDNSKGGKKCHVLIFDLGGGTFDVSLLKIEEGVFEVKATAGDTHLGGEDFDNTVVDFLLSEAASAGFPAARDDEKAFRRLRLEVERVKRLLSAQDSAELRVEAFGTDGKDFVYTLTREKFEALNAGLFERCLDTVRRVIKDGKMKQSEIDEVVLVGGSTRIPKIQAMLQEFLGGKELCKSLNPDEAVAYGAAVQGAILSGRRHRATEDLLLMDVTPLSLGIETTGRVMSVIIPRNTPIPTVMTQVYTTEADYQTAVDISVYEGERLKTEENNLLGEFTITGIQRAKKGEPKVSVSFALDSNGILNVKAVDQDTGAEAHIEISNRSRASAEEVERMIKDAEKYRKDDEVRMRRVEAANRLEEVINEALEHAESLRGSDDRLSALIQNAAQNDATWLEENRDSGVPADFLAKVRDLQRRITSKNRRR